MGFLLSRRWLGFFGVVLLLTVLAIRLGDWQFDRLHERRAKNAETRTNLAAAPVPAGDVLRVGHELSDDQEWRRVTATGTWDTRHTVVIRYQSREAGQGVDVVTPLVTSSGAAYAVDRGWLPVADSSSTLPRTPTPAAGEVTVTGYVRVDGSGGSTQIDDHSARAISSSALARTVSYPVYGGFVMMTSQVPRSATSLGAPQLPELDDGPHFFYGLQWWFFGALAIIGFLYLAYDEWRQRRTERDQDRPAGRAPRHRSSDSTDVLVRTD